MNRQPYIPALRFGWLTRFYDPLIHATLKETRLERRLIDQGGVRPGHRVLDVGCVTGTLTLMIKRACPDAEVVGLDGDPKVLVIARDKSRAFLAVQLFDGFGTTADNAHGLLPPIMRDAGFEAVAETHREMTVVGTLALYRARKPESL